MNAEYVAWFAVLVAVGVAVVAYLAFGPVPEIPAAEPDDVTEAVPARDVTEAVPGESEVQGAPVSTTEPGPSAPAGTSETP